MPHVIAPVTQVEPHVIGLHIQVVNNPQAPQCKGLLEQVEPYKTGEHTQVLPNTIGEHTQVLPVNIVPLTAPVEHNKAV